MVNALKTAIGAALACAVAVGCTGQATAAQNSEQIAQINVTAAPTAYQNNTAAVSGDDQAAKAELEKTVITAMNLVGTNKYAQAGAVKVGAFQVALRNAQNALSGNTKANYQQLNNELAAAIAGLDGTDPDAAQPLRSGAAARNVLKASTSTTTRAVARGNDGYWLALIVPLIRSVYGRAAGPLVYVYGL